MNRHQSNPFLSDWDDEVSTRVPQTNPHLFDANTPLPASELAGSNMNSSQAARRSSCSQAENSSSSTSAATRQMLYRRNMSSFEAASLQLEQHQQQMLENGSTGLDNQKDLIAKMTADFQSAISTNDQQFEDFAFNPFDPFETIVDDDVNPNSPAPTSQQQESSRFDLELDRPPASRAHDSIDDDEAELVSTPVRNIKSLPPNADEHQASDGTTHQKHVQDYPNSDSDTTTNREESSIAKATLFASLLAEAENSQQADGAQPGDGSQVDELDQTNGSPINVEPTAHVIKGSPNSIGDGNDRPVSFFDPFETVFDKDALTSLVSESQQQNASQQQSSEVEGEDLAQPQEAENRQPNTNKLQATRANESASIETVIESSFSPRNAQEQEQEQAQQEQVEISTPPQDEETSSSPAGEATQEDATDHQGELHYDSASALERPSGRRLELSSGIVAPQPTPMKRPTRQPKKKASFQEDSSDSSEDDDRIQIVIRARAETNAVGDASGQQAPAIVPLLPPPPSKSSMKQARERGQVEDIPSPIMGYKNKTQRRNSYDDDDDAVSPARGEGGTHAHKDATAKSTHESQAKKSKQQQDQQQEEDEPETEDEGQDGGQFVIPMTLSDDDGDTYGKPETPLYDDDTSYVLEEYPQKYEGPGWDMMLRYPPKKKLTANRFWKKIFVKLAQVPLAPLDSKSGSKTENSAMSRDTNASDQQMCWALQIFDHQNDKKPMQEIPIQATYTVSEISSQLFDQFGKIFTIKLQYIFYKERVGVRQGQLARFIHTGHIGSSTTSGGHGVDPISIGAIKRMGAPIEHSPQISQIIKLGCINYEAIKQFKEALEDCLFRMPIHRDRALSTYKTEEVQMAVRDETYVEVNQIGTVTKQLARVRLFFLSFLNGMPIVEVGINDFHRQGREVVGRMDILPVVTEEWIRLEAWDLHSTVEKEDFENPDTRIIKLTPPDATFFELMRFRIRPPRNRELPLQISANMSVTRTKVSVNCEVMVPGCVSRKHGQIPCENIAIRVYVPECWIYFFREEKHFRMGSKKSVNRRPGKVKGIERFLGGGGGASAGLQDFSDESSLIEVTSGQAKYEHHHHAVVWRAARWPKETQSAYVQNTMKIRLPLTAFDKMPENFYEFIHVEYTMPATTVSHTTLRSISVNPYDEEPPEKYVKYAAKYEYKVKMRLSVNLGGRTAEPTEPEASPIVIMKQADLQDDLQREEDVDDDDDDDDEPEA